MNVISDLFMFDSEQNEENQFIGIAGDITADNSMPSEPDKEISDLEIEALVDNELNPYDQYRVMIAIMKCADKSRKFEELLHQKAMLKKYWKKYGQLHSQ